MLEAYIENNLWITKSETYETGEYLKYYYENIPKIDLNNISSVPNLNKFLNFWKLYEHYPNEIYLYVAVLSKEDKKEIKNKHLKELINLGINYFAIVNNNIELLIFLLENNSITNNQALIYASKNGHLDVVEYLVDHGANLNVEDDNSLQWASSKGHLKVVEYLVDHGANVNAQDDYALILASKNGHLDVVEYLVDHGANVNARDDYALRWASNNGHLDIVEYLVNHGANIHAYDDQALRWASKYGHVDVVNFLRNLGPKA